MQLRLAAAVLLLLGTLCPAQDTPPVPAPPAPPAPAAPSEEGDTATTKHQVTVGGRILRYEAIAGTMPLPDYDGKPKAEVFFIAYTGADGEGSPGRRPITFAFNGGPGSSSVWLHLGALGPRRVLMGDDEGAAPVPPYQLVENEHCWLDMTDLVFVDPVGTGYSRPVEGESAKQFHGLDEDIQWMGDFIRLYTTRHRRWDSPKFLAGESYGTTRAAGLAGYLQNTHGMFLSGIVLVSPVLNFQTVRFDTGNDTPYWLFLPTYAATAWHHGRLGPRLQENLERTLREVEQFAASEYLLALAHGDSLPEAERARIAESIAAYTGLSQTFVENSNLRINIFHFTKELLRDQRRTVGRLDSRYTGIDSRAVGAGHEYDPSYAAIQGPYTAALNHYIRTELAYENDRPYEILTGRVHPWSYASASNRYANVAETLREAMSKNRNLHVLFACGYFDLATPYFASDYTASHLGLDPELRSNIHRSYYRSGHMMYIRTEDLAKLKADAHDLYRAAVGGPAAEGPG